MNRKYGKLGKLPPKQHPKTLNFTKYLTSIPTPPEEINFYSKLPANGWGVLGNDLYGDCTCAAICHMDEVFTSNANQLIPLSTNDALNIYSAVTGFNPGPPVVNDNGAVITDILQYWQNNGIPHKRQINGKIHHVNRKILAWAQVNQNNLTEVQQALYLFGSVDIGVNLPESAETQFENNQPWTIVQGSPNAGGHSVPIVGYTEGGAVCITWGETQSLDWDWFNQYCDEAYVVITEDWINKNSGQTIEGFDLVTLEQDISDLSGFRTPQEIKKEEKK